MKIKHLNVLLAFFLFTPQGLLALDINKSIDSWAEKGFEVRKTFAGSVKDAGLPAELTYVNSDAESDFYNIDLAIKIVDWSLLEQDRHQLLLSPIIERHKNTKENAEVDNTSFSLGLQYDLGVGECTTRGIRVPNCDTIFLDTLISGKRDSEKDETTRSATLYFGYTTRDRSSAFRPGYRNFRQNQYLFSYLPSFGLETYEKLPIETVVDGETILVADEIDESFYAAKLSMKYRVLSETFENKVVLTMDHTHRFLMGSSEFVDDTTRFTVVSLDYFFDEKERMSFGVTYSNGEDPSRNFLDEETTKIGFKFILKK